MSKPKPGTILWHDLTVSNASAVRDFYHAVIGWDPAPVDMGDYEDFSMKPKGEKSGVAGVCNARGPNENMPPQWLCYVAVASLDDSLATVTALGGSVVVEARPLGKGKFAVIKDPAGAVIALYEA